MWKWKQSSPDPAPALEFVVTDDALRLPLVADTDPLAWLQDLSARSPDTLAGVRARVLRQWLEEDRAVPGEGGLHVTFESFFEADPADIHALDLAPASPFRHRLRARGAFSDPDFTLELDRLPAPGFALHGWVRQGVFLTGGSGRVLLDRAHHDLYRAVEAFARREDADRSHDAHLTSFARIRLLAEAAGVVLDDYLAGEEAIVPGEVSVALEPTADGGLLVRPELEGIDVATLEHGLDRHRHDVPPVLTLPGQAPSDRRRVVLTPRIREGVRQVRKLRRLTPAEAERFTRHPELFLDPDKVKLDDLGARVLSIGQVTSTMHPLIAREPRSWMPDEVSLVLERADGEVTTLAFRRLEDHQPLLDAYSRADASGDATFEFAGHRLATGTETRSKLETLQDALHQIARKPDDVAPEKKQSGDAPAGPDGPKVILVKENLDDLAYVETAVDTTLPASAMEPIPDLLDGVTLLPHQERGIAWMQHACRHGKPGVLLADDMGLGKTLQILAFWRWFARVQPDAGPLLVIAPVALLENWDAEVQKFLDVPLRGILPLHGGSLERIRLSGTQGHELGAGEPVRKLDIGRIQRCSLVLTNYETVRNYQFSLATVDWGIVVLDEAQKAKNPLALQTRAIKALKARFRILATGTPVENDLGDLWSLVDIAHPGHLGSLSDFRKNHAPVPGGTIAPERMHALVERISPTMLRRMKVSILRDLPPKHEHPIAIEMSAVQQRVYQRILGDIRSSASTRDVMLQALHHLRLVSVHPALVETGQEGRVQLKHLKSESPKLAEVLAIVQRWQLAGEKGILFAREKVVQRLLQRLLEERFGTPVAIVNGETPATDARRSGDSVQGAGRTRKQLLDRFQASPGFGMIILSPEAVGYGLTLTEANHVVHVTRLWNPAKEDQATDRVYRIGQTRPVHVHLPMATASGFASFDGVLHRLLTEKRALASSILHPVGQMDMNDDLIRMVCG